MVNMVASYRAGRRSTSIMRPRGWCCFDDFLTAEGLWRKLQYLKARAWPCAWCWTLFASTCSFSVVQAHTLSSKSGRLLSYERRLLLEVDGSPSWCTACLGRCRPRLCCCLWEWPPWATISGVFNSGYNTFLQHSVQLFFCSRIQGEGYFP